MSGRLDQPRWAEFSPLRFAEPLEAEFRRRHAAVAADAARLPLWLAALLMSLLSLLDWRALPAEVSAHTNLVRLGLILPGLMVALAATYPGKLLRHAARLRSVAAVVWAFGTVVLVRLTQGSGYDSATLWESLVVTLYVYLLLGLRLTPALLSASAVLLAVLFFRAQPVGPAAAYGPVLLTFVNIIGALACFRAERGARAEFLEQEVVNLIVGTDGVTGIPNRHAFDSHLRSAWRQAQRETRRVAVMLVEIDYFETFAARHGRQIADVALRRVAHTVLSCARRPLDRAARHAQATLALVLFDPDPKFLETVASRVRSEVALLDIDSDVPEAKGRLTVSIGVAVATARPGQADDALMTAATEALASRAPERHRLVIRLEADPSESAILRGPWRSAPAK